MVSYSNLVDTTTSMQIASAALNGLASTSVSSFVTVDEETLVNDYAVHAYFQRAKFTLYVMIVVAGDEDVLTSAAGADWGDGDTWNKYKDVIWGTQIFFGGMAQDFGESARSIDYKTGTSRRLKSGQQFGVIFYIEDVNNGAADYRVAWMSRYHWKTY